MRCTARPPSACADGRALHNCCWSPLQFSASDLRPCFSAHDPLCGTWRHNSRVGCVPSRLVPPLRGASRPQCRFSSALGWGRCLLTWDGVGRSPGAHVPYSLRVWPPAWQRCLHRSREVRSSHVLVEKVRGHAFLRVSLPPSWCSAWPARVAGLALCRCVLVPRPPSGVCLGRLSSRLCLPSCLGCWEP